MWEVLQKSGLILLGLTVFNILLYFLHKFATCLSIGIMLICIIICIVIAE